MRIVAWCFVLFLSSGCFATSMELRGQGMDYSASGLLGPGPMEAGAAYAVVRGADAYARSVEAHVRFMETLLDRQVGCGGWPFMSPYQGYYQPLIQGGVPASQMLPLGCRMQHVLY